MKRSLRIDPTTTVACTLSSRELAERRQQLKSGLMDALIETQPIEGGMTWRFEDRSGVWEMLAEFVAFERRCCRFLSFQLRINAQHHHIDLDLTGPEGTQEFLKEQLDLMHVVNTRCRVAVDDTPTWTPP